MHDRVVAGHGVLERSRVADVALDERVARAVVDVFHRREVSRVGERVVDGDFVVRVREYVTYVVGADETGATSDELLHVTSARRNAAATAVRCQRASGSCGRGPTGSDR